VLVGGLDGAGIMRWQLTWLGSEGGQEEVASFSSLSQAKEGAEDLDGSLQWDSTMMTGDVLRDDEEIFTARSMISPLGARERGEYVISKASRDAAALESRIYNNSDLHREDREHPLVPVLHEAIREERFLAYQYTNSKRKTYPALLRPTGWMIYEHDHGWAGGHTLCVVGYCYHHRETRNYAIRRMAEVRVLRDPTAELARLGWAHDAGGAARIATVKSVNAVGTKLTRPVVAPGDLVDHATFGRGEVIAIDLDLRRVTIAFGSVGEKKLALDVAPLASLDGRQFALDSR
jgi:hypothetical protein